MDAGKTWEYLFFEAHGKNIGALAGERIEHGAICTFT